MMRLPLLAFNDAIAVLLSLGAGGLSLLALIVAILTGTRIDALRREVMALRRVETTGDSPQTKREAMARLTTGASQAAPTQMGEVEAAPSRGLTSAASDAEDETRSLGCEPAASDESWVAVSEVPPPSRGSEPAAEAVEPVTMAEAEAPAPTTPRSFEELLGAKLFVWVGGIALAAAVAFLLKWSFDRELVTPAVRVLGGAVFGLGLLGAAEWVRQRKDQTAVTQALSGAGLASLYAVLFAATNLYQFVGPTFGFTLTAALTAGAIALALKHGVFTAALGLVGGFVMPVLLEPDPTFGGGFVAYLLLLQAGLVTVARCRQWIGLSVATFIAGGVWAGLVVAGALDITHAFWVEVLLLGSAAVFIGGAADAGWAGVPHRVWRTSLAVVAGAGAAMMLALHVGLSGFEPRGLWMLGLLIAACLVLARWQAQYVALPWAALGTSVALLMGWAMDASWLRAVESIEPTFATRFGWAAGAYGVVFALGGFACLWRSARPSVFAALSSSGGLVLSVLTVAALWDAVPTGFAWWAVVGGVALVYAVLTAARMNTKEGTASEDGAKPILALSAAGLAAFAIGLGLYDNPPWLGIGWAALALGLVLAREAAELPTLRWGVVGATALAGVALLVAPGPFFEVARQRVVFNQLLPAYALPASLFAACAWRFAAGGVPRWASAYHAVTLACIALGFTFMTRHAFTPGRLLGSFALLEAGTLAAGYALLGFAGYGLSRWVANAPLRLGGVTLIFLGLGVAIAGPALLLNPLWRGGEVGPTIVLNGLLFLYLLPAALGAAATVMLTRSADKALLPGAAVTGAASLLLLFTWVTLSVRQGFVGGVIDLDAHPVGAAEQYAYSMAWLALGLGLLFAGVFTGSKTLRFGSLAVMLLTVVKVFAFDAAALQDLWRVLSFLLLGLSLIGLGWVYQRYVFGGREEAEAHAD